MNTIQVSILVIINISLLAYALKLALGVKFHKSENAKATEAIDRMSCEAIRRREDLRAAERALHSATEQYRREFISQRNENTKLKQELAALRSAKSTLLSIKFHARVPHFSGHQKTEFKLGLGPCGLTVQRLLVNELEDRIVIEQLCDNGERKTFDYMKSDISGHIEKRWEK